MDRRTFIKTTAATTVGAGISTEKSTEPTWIAFEDQMPKLGESITIKKPDITVENVCLISIDDVDDYQKEEVETILKNKKNPFLCKHDEMKKIIAGNKKDWQWRYVGKEENGKRTT